VARIDKQRLQRLAHLFDTAVELPTGARAAFIDTEADDDPALRDELLRLLDRDERLVSARTVSVVDRLATELPDLVAERDWRGAHVGHYELAEEIGRGGMGRVYRARRIDGAFDREVAVKLVARDALNPALLRRFSTERAVLAALDHPGICRLLDAGSADDGTPWVAMDLIRGAPITTWCDARRLDLADRVALFRQVLAAVSHAHRNLVVHRDIKPSNVLVDDGGQPHLLDFGIAKPLHTAEPGNATATAERYFTLTHAAPEQWRGGPVTVACDVYALGVLLHELLAGAPPFEFRDLTPGRIETLILDTPAPPPSRTAGERGDASAQARGAAGSEALRRALRGDLDAIVQKALRKEPLARYASVEQLDADLAAWLQNRPVAARGGHGWYRARKFVGRHRWAVAGATAVAMTVLAATLVVATQSVEVRRERDRAERSLALLRSAFHAADPARSAGADLSARQIMEAARRDLSALQDTQPELYVELAATIADVEIDLGLSEDAASLAGNALAMGTGDRAIRRQLALLKARADTRAGRLDDAEAALAVYRDGGDADTPEYLYARGMLATQQRRYDAARADLTSAIDATRAVAATDTLAFRARLELAQLLRRQNQLPEALALLDATLSGLLAPLQADHPHRTLTRMRRIDLLRQLGRVDEAIAEARASATIVEQAYGRTSPVYASALRALGLALSTARDPAAISAFGEAVEIYREQLGPDHAITLREQFNLAMELGKHAGTGDAADKLFGQTISAAGRTFGARSETLAFFRAGQAESLLRRTRPAEALAALLAIPDGVFASAPPDAVASLRAAHAQACTGEIQSATCEAGAARLASAGSAR
jgi:serine/threonine-protein kinase